MTTAGPSMATRKRTAALPTTETPHATSSKRRRRCLTIEEKVKLLDCMDAGCRPSDLAREHDISESAIRTLQHSHKQLRNFAAQCTAEAYKSTAYIPRDLTLERVEQLLFAWYGQKRSEGQTLTITSICAKARQLWSELKSKKAAARADEVDSEREEEKEEEEEERDFKASKGWFVKFRKRYKLDFMSCHETAPLDIEAARLYPSTFQATIKAGGYLPQQVFNAAEFTLAWKRMPDRCIVAQRDRSRNRIGYDRLSLLLCSNAAGDFSVKPLLVYRTLTPFCLRTRSAEDLPVFLRARDRESQRVPKMTPSHFREWLLQCFVPAVRDYFEIMELPARCLLLLDAELQEIHLQLEDTAVDDFVQLVFLPPHTAPLLQPVTLSVVPIFKCNYMRRLFAHFIRRLDAAPASVKVQCSFFKYWRNFNISEGIDIINDSLEELQAACWNGGWRRLWKQVVPEPYSVSSALNYGIQRVVDIGCNLPGPGFADMTMEDIQAHLKMENNVGFIKAQSVKAEQESAFERLLFGADFDEAQEEMEDIEELDNLGILDVDTNSEKITPAAAKHISNKSDLAQNSSTLSTNAARSVRVCEKTKNAIKVQSLKKALALSQQLLAAIGQVESPSKRERHFNFVNGLNALMLPYREMKEQLLQPSIRDYFAS